jgi:hypothetical protein
LHRGEAHDWTPASIAFGKNAKAAPASFWRYDRPSQLQTRHRAFHLFALGRAHCEVAAASTGVCRTIASSDSIH